MRPRVLLKRLRQAASGFDRKRVVILDERGGWVIDEEVRLLRRALDEGGFDVDVVGDVAGIRHSVIHFPSMYLLLQRLGGVHPSNRLTCSWYHGDPETSEEFAERFRQVALHHPLISRVHVTNDAFKNRVLKTGIDHAKVIKIPIGVDLEHFRPMNSAMRAGLRKDLGLPESAFVIGSFQKDGVGWGEGLEPKLVKGPDVFLATVKSLTGPCPLHVLLTGPSRGFVKNGLDELGVPYTHREVDNLSEMSGFYSACDAYLVTSREEGGPKAVLECFATGVPVVSTRVGQAAEIIRDGIDGFLVDTGDVGALSDRIRRLAADRELRRSLAKNAFGRVCDYSADVIGRRMVSEFFSL